MLKAFVDHHTHSNFSWDSETSLEDLINGARKVELQGIVLTDHIEFHSGDNGFGYYNYDKCLDAFEVIRQTTPDIKIKFGAEVSHHPKHLSEIKTFLHSHRFNFVIGSNHNIGWQEVPDAISKLESEGDNFKESLQSYFDETINLVESNFYDALGHLDFPKRFIKKKIPSDFFLKHYERAIRAILTACLDMGVFLEVNTAPYRAQIYEPYPSFPILALYKKLGGREVILSSDAHRPEDLGTMFNVVVKELSKMEISVRNAV